MKYDNILESIILNLKKHAHISSSFSSKIGYYVLSPPPPLLPSQLLHILGQIYDLGWMPSLSDRFLNKLDQTCVSSFVKFWIEFLRIVCV